MVHGGGPLQCMLFLSTAYPSVSARTVGKPSLLHAAFFSLPAAPGNFLPVLPSFSQEL